MMDCKKALKEAKGDFAKAEKILKGLGLAAAAKRAGRATNEGRVFIKTSAQKSIILELSCETDFVAKNKDFKVLGEELAATILEKKLNPKDKAVETIISNTIAKIKENITLKRLSIIETQKNETYCQYIHGEGRIGVIVKLKLEDPGLMENDKIKDFAFNIALHIAAFAPLYLAVDRIDADYLKEQEEIFKKQVQNLKKPEKVLEGIVKGKIKKLYSEICLLEQGYVKNEKMKVHQILENLSKEIGSSIEISDYAYYKVGE